MNNNILNKVVFKFEGKNNVNINNILQKEKIDNSFLCNCNLKTYLISNVIKFEIIKYLGEGIVGKVFLIKLLDNYEEEIQELKKTEQIYEILNTNTQIIQEQKQTNNPENNQEILEKEKIQQLLEKQENLFTLKISNIDSYYELYEEILLIQENLNNNDINIDNYPLYYGDFKNYRSFGIIYPFFGIYNLEKIKSLSLLNETKINLNYFKNIKIIKQLIIQLSKLNINNIIHCDLKPCNIVINELNNNIKATIIDFGLIKNVNNLEPIMSTSYITSPESLLTIDKFKNILNKKEIIDYSKSDYFGLYTIILQLFLNKSYWKIIHNYLNKFCNYSFSLIDNSQFYIVYAYVWYKFFYNDYENIKSVSMKNLIVNIEYKYQFVKTKKYLKFDKFFEYYIISNIEPKYFEDENYNTDIFSSNLFDFLKSLINFEPKDRPSFIELLEHPFLNP